MEAGQPDSVMIKCVGCDYVRPDHHPYFEKETGKYVEGQQTVCDGTYRPSDSQTRKGYTSARRVHYADDPHIPTVFIKNLVGEEGPSRADQGGVEDNGIGSVDYWVIPHSRVVKTSETNSYVFSVFGRP